MSHWDYMDKKVWESSEVMQELEKIFIKEADVQKKIQDLNNLTNAAANAAKAGKALKDSGLMADDGAAEVEEKPKKEKVKKTKKKISKKSHKKAKAQLMSELKHLSMNAGLAGDHKLAYSIDRAIDELLEGEE
jgi:hypothetical protein